MRSKFTGGGPRQDLRCRLGSNDVSQRDRTINVSRTQGERRKSRELGAASAGAFLSRPADRAVYLFVFAWLCVARPAARCPRPVPSSCNDGTATDNQAKTKRETARSACREKNDTALAAPSTL